MSNAPLVSVVMCAYNGLPFIKEAVADIVRQSYSHWELIISDDASTDGTREWLQQNATDSRIRLVMQPRNLGYLRNKNAAMQEVSGDLITQQDCDDRTHPDRLRLQVEALARTGLKIVGCGYNRLDAGGTLVNTVAPREEMVIEERVRAGGSYPFWFPSLMITREVHESVGAFDPYFVGIFGDDQYWTVKANERFPILCLPQPLYGYRDAPASITSLLDNPRKLIVPEILARLIDQRQRAGTDDLERGDLAALATFERGLLEDKPFLSRRYQLYAARGIDQNRFGEARRLLGEAWRLQRWRPGLLRTWLYYLRARLGARP